MAKEYDISTLSLDEIEPVVDSYEPYDPAEPPSFTPSQLEPNPDVLTDDEVRKKIQVQDNPDVMTDDEMFNRGEYSYKFLGMEAPAGIVESYKNVVEKTTDVAKRGIWKGIGAIAWPFERIEYGIGTPIESMLRSIGPLARTANRFSWSVALDTPIAKSMYKNKVREMLSPYAIKMLGDNLETVLEDKANKLADGWLTHEGIMDSLTESKAGAEDILPSFYHGAKSFVPFTHTDPEKVKNFNDMWGAYYEEIVNEPAPEWYKQTAGIGTSYLTAPVVLGKILGGAKAGASKLPFVQKALANRIPTWQDAKLIREANIYERNEKAAQLGKTLANKDAKRIANELTKRTGKTVTKEAVKLRLGQIIKGSITQETMLAEKANPVIEELSKNFGELKKLGVMSDKTYLTKLSKAEIIKLNVKKAKLSASLTKIETGVPYKETLLKKISTLHPDIRKQQALADRLVKIAERASKDGKTIADVSDELIEAAYEVQTGSPLAKTVASLLDFKPGNKQLTKLGNKILSLEKMERVARQKEAKNIIKIASKLDKQVAKATEKTVNDLMVAADQIESSTVIGQKPLSKYVETMKYRFPGKAKKIQDLQKNIGEIDETLWNATHFGKSGQLYMPRMYATKEGEIAARKFPVTSAGPKIKAPYAKQRKDIPIETRKEMGEFFEPAYPVTKRLIQESQDIETAKLFKFAASKGEWVDDVWRTGLAENPLPNTKTYGALAGKYVHPKIYNDVTELNRVRSNFETIYDSIIGTWKIGKVTLNPATHFRNTFSNGVLLDLSGMDHAKQSKYFVKALGEIRKGSEEYKVAKKFFGHSTMMNAEIMDDLMAQVNKDTAQGVQKSINMWNNVFGKVTAGPSKVYQQEEFIFKFMKFIEQREKGMSAIKSVNEANKWLFDYGDLSRFEKVVARRVMPFYTFPRKALPRILEAAEKNPMALAKYPIMMWAEEKYALSKLDMTEQDYQDVQDTLPDYMTGGSYMLLPFRDANGKLQFFDWTYILPWGELYNAQDRGLLGSIVTNPAVQVTADIMRNKSGFSGREIWKETDTPKEQTFKKMIHFWQTAVPSLMYKGIYWDKMYNGVTGKPSKMGEIAPVAPMVAHTLFGLRTQAVDPEQQAIYRQYEKMSQAQELEKKIADISIRETNGNITEEEYDQKREQYMEQIQSLFNEKEEG